MTGAFINKIIPFSLVDGPGSRTSIFLQGCNIQCGYCHNPETQNMCVHCGKCVQNCPTHALHWENDKVVFDVQKCVSCDTCIRGCPHFSSPKTQYLSSKQVCEIISSNLPLIRGITVSGGECMLHPEFLKEVFLFCKQKGLTTLIDSNGTLSFRDHPDLMEVCDGVMLDIKSWKKDTFLKVTNNSPGFLYDNIQYLNQTNKIEEIRIVCLENIVDAQTTIQKLPEFLDEKRITTRLKLISFRPNGVRGVFADQKPPSEKYMNQLYQLAAANGFTNIVLT